LDHRKLQSGWDEHDYVVVVEHVAKTWKDESIVWSKQGGKATRSAALVPASPADEPVAFGVRDGDGGVVPCCVELKNIPTDISWEQLKAYCLSFGKLAALHTT
jgi:hypothetical protein